MTTLYRTVIVSLASTDKPYLCDLPKIKVGDKVIVPTSHRTPKDWETQQLEIGTIIKVMGLSARERNSGSLLILSSISLKGYKKRLKRLRTYREIKNKLSQARDEYEDLMIYKTLAKDDPSINKLLSELEGLSKPKLLEGGS